MKAKQKAWTSPYQTCFIRYVVCVLVSIHFTCSLQIVREGSSPNSELANFRIYSKYSSFSYTCNRLLVQLIYLNAACIFFLERSSNVSWRPQIKGKAFYLPLSAYHFGVSWGTFLPAIKATNSSHQTDSGIWCCLLVLPSIPSIADCCSDCTRNSCSKKFMRRKMSQHLMKEEKEKAGKQSKQCAEFNTHCEKTEADPLGAWLLL